MSTRLYLMPAVTETINGRLTKHPKYAMTPGLGGSQFMDFGAEGFFLCAVDLDDTAHALIAANADVISINVANLETQLGAVWATAVTTKLESVNCPADWITSVMSHRDSLKTIVRMFLFLQALQNQLGLTGSFFVGGVNLDRTVSFFSAATRQKLRDALTQLGIETSWVVNTTTVRQLMKGCADRWSGGQNIAMLDVTL